MSGTEDEKTYWSSYYSSRAAPVQPSSFAEFCIGYIGARKSLFEGGCGNGRDASFFIQQGLNVSACDISDEAVKALRTKHPDSTFYLSSFSELPQDTSYDVVYSRFSLHAAPKLAASRFLEWSYAQLNSNGLLCIEARSTKDPLYGKGIKVEGEEHAFRGTTSHAGAHYRRFIDIQELKTELLDLGFKILYSLEADGLSVYQTDNPVLVRIVASKKD